MASKRLKQESFRKRRHNFIRRGHEISERYSVGVYICILKENGQYYVYNSHPTKANWPPTSSHLVGLKTSPNSVMRTLIPQSSAYPVPQIKTPQDYIAVEDGGKRSLPYKRVSSLPRHLPKPPVPGYGQEEIFLGRQLEGMQRQNGRLEAKTSLAPHSTSPYDGSDLQSLKSAGLLESKAYQK
ncbi:hypothetical protein BU23DRAFT_572982 [Bimuria novae-zelandiae CBS 107.79]|uniref:MADS-box domain-containing protein n=1 Tax=Bimuria novae-zelandiae CBS 107.79 TaxID=1447943 RepID=A0A6A5USJ9_9PLEO|nr:hypothetical protein BU23DRAFT_572982 [Bimuria novae-zelandiae CBS 107.79]